MHISYPMDEYTVEINHGTPKKGGGAKKGIVEQYVSHG